MANYDEDATLQEEDEYIVDDEGDGYDDYAGDEVEAYGDAEDYGDDPEAYYEVYEEEDFDPYDDDERPLGPEEERALLEGCSEEELREMCASRPSWTARAARRRS